MQVEGRTVDPYNRAVALMKEGNPVAALKAYHNILEGETTTPSLRSMIYNDVGSILYYQGDMVKGEEFIKKAIFTDLFNDVAYRNLQQIYSVKVKRQYKFSIVIPTFNKIGLLKKCLENIRRNSFFPAEILVICDPCEDGTEDYLVRESEKEDVTAIINEKHLGVIACINMGLLKSSGDYICILNDDVEVMPGWDLSIVCAIDADPLAGCAVPLVISERGRVANPGSYYPFKSVRFDWIGKFSEVDALSVTGNTLENFADFQIPRECDYGYFPVMKRECYDKVGGLDPLFTHNCADTDLGYRIQQQGYKNIYCPTSVMIHCWMSNHRGTSNKVSSDEPKLYEKWGLTKNGVKMTDLFKAQNEGQTTDLYNRAVALATEGNAEEALRIYKDMLQGEVAAASCSLRSMVYNDIGSIMYSGGHADNGEEFVKKAIFAYFLNTVAYRNLQQINAAKVKREYKFSIVIPTYNRIGHLKKCLESIRRNSFFPLELIVVCDPCDDGTEDYLIRESEKGDIIALINEKHAGVIESTNMGMLKSSGDYICILNDDVEVMPGWDLSIVCTIDDDPLAGCASSLVISEKALVANPGSYNHFKSIYFDWIGKFVSVDPSYVFGKTLENFPEFQSSRECDFALFPVIKRECYEKVGGLDPQFKHYYADPDLGYRIQAIGYKTIYCPTSVIMHYSLSDQSIDTGLKALTDEPRFHEKWGLTKNGVEMTEVFRSKWAEKLNQLKGEVV